MTGLRTSSVLHENNVRWYSLEATLIPLALIFLKPVNYFQWSPCALLCCFGLLYYQKAQYMNLNYKFSAKEKKIPKRFLLADRFYNDT